MNDPKLSLENHILSNVNLYDYFNCKWSLTTKFETVKSHECIWKTLSLLEKKLFFLSVLAETGVLKNKGFCHILHEIHQNVTSMRNKFLKYFNKLLLYSCLRYLDISYQNICLVDPPSETGTPLDLISCS
jgi:hypothetical protein